MPSAPWAGPPWRRSARHGTAPAVRDAPCGDPRPWRLRRVVLLALVVAGAVAATQAMARVLPEHGSAGLEKALLALFGVLFAWISAGFWTAAMGAWVLLRGSGADAVTRVLRNVAPDDPLPPEARTAVVMPIRNEDVATVFAGLRATIESLAGTPHGANFDFFVLSDTDRPDARAAEQAAWCALVDAVAADGVAARVFYRWRQRRTRRKAGNVADFCRRWGRGWRYMVILDADSVMSGACLADLVRLMEAHPDAGIVQTAPRAGGHATPHARVQQFGARVYGPLFTAGMSFWQLGDSHYWGHNAIVRIAPFMRHCALAPLPGRGPLGGEVMSHDFVEAALMRRAGWTVWIAHDLDGSYEQFPPNLLAELQRDRRWCHGNLQNARLLFEPGWTAVHRSMFLSGVMAYLSAPLWLAFLLLSTALFADHAGDVPQYFVESYQLFPIWPSVDLRLILTLFGLTAALLLAPKAFAVGVIVVRRQARRYGGAARLCAGAVVEILHSMLLAPVRMLFHTQFVAAALTGWRLEWQSPPRHDAATGWGEAARRHGGHALLAGLWIVLLLASGAPFPWWLTPILAGLLVGMPVSVWTSRAATGRRPRRAGLFAIPEEIDVPPVLAAARRHAQAAKAAGDAGLFDALRDVRWLDAVGASCPLRPPAAGAKGRAQAERIARVAAAGQGKADADDCLRLLASAEAIRALHLAMRSGTGAGPVTDGTAAAAAAESQARGTGSSAPEAASAEPALAAP